MNSIIIKYTIKELIDLGIHIGNIKKLTNFRINKWFIYCIRNNICIINVKITLIILKQLYIYIYNLIKFKLILIIYLGNLKNYSNKLFLDEYKKLGKNIILLEKIWIKGFFYNIKQMFFYCRRIKKKQIIKKKNIIESLIELKKIKCIPDTIIMFNLNLNIKYILECLDLNINLISVVDTINNINNISIKIPGNAKSFFGFEFFNIFYLKIIKKIYNKIIINWFNKYKYIIKTFI